MAELVEGINVEAQALQAEAEFEAKVGRREMRRQGVTLLEMRRRVKQMARAGELTKEMTPAQVRETVLDDICSDNPRIVEAIDWDALLAFIEKLIPLILQLIALFG
jgi:hypothetical protein